MGDPQESANERRHEHVEAVEEILDSIDPALEEHAYPVNSEDLSAQYAESVEGLPNETESLGSVFDRLEDDEYDSPMAVKEAVLQEVTDASPAPGNAGDGRAPAADHGGTPEEVVDDLESEAVAESTRTPEGAGPGPESGSAGAAADAAGGPETDAAEPGDEMTPDTTAADEFAPQETVEDRDREGDRRASADRSSDRGDPWEAAEDEPGDPAEPTAEPAEEELDPEQRESEVPDARDADDASEASERARYEGDDEEPLEGVSAEAREADQREASERASGDTASSPVPDARDEDSGVDREGNLPDNEDDGSE